MSGAVFIVTVILSVIVILAARPRYPYFNPYRTGKLGEMAGRIVGCWDISAVIAMATKGVKFKTTEKNEEPLGKY